MSKTIVIVDSDELVRELLGIRLSNAGYRCHAAADGAAALRLLAGGSVDAVIMDTIMPMLSGAETLVRLRADPALSHIPVLILSQKNTPDEQRLYRSLGAAAFLPKPFCCEEVLEEVARALVQAEPRRSSRLKVTVLGAAALSAALPAQAQEQQTGQSPSPALMRLADLAGANGSEPAAGTSDISGQQAIPVPRPDLQSPSPSVLPPEPEARSSWQTRHSATVTQGYSWIDGIGGQDWNDTAVTYSFRPTARSGYSAEVSRAERFGLSDYQLTARGDWRVGERGSVYAAVVVTPSAKFREKRGLRAGFSRTLMPHVEVGASSRLGVFNDGTKLAVTPYLALSSTGEKLTLVAEVINLWNLDGPANYQSGFGVRVTGQPTGRLRALGGYARYPEVELDLTRDVRSIYGGISYDVSDAIGVSASYANDRYENLFTRDGLTVGLTYRWRGPG